MRARHTAARVGFTLVGLMLADGLAEAAKTTATQPTDTTVLVRSNTAFALDLYRELSSGSGNLFLSPYGLSTALAMTSAGAAGRTESQMADVLHLAMPRRQLHPAYAALAARLHKSDADPAVQLLTANALWCRKGLGLRDEFMTLARRHGPEAARQVDFAADPEAARRAVNDWVAQQTRRRIKELLGSGTIGGLTQLVLTNAVAFRGQWTHAFSKESTREEDFQVEKGKTVAVPLMSQKGRFGYLAGNGFQALELPYGDGDLSMVVLLPDRVGGLAALEKAMTPKALSAWLGDLDEDLVLVFLPRFKMAAALELADVLGSMGMADAFAPRTADFSRLAENSKGLYLSAVVHKAFVEVNERGTEATGASGVVVTRKGGFISKVFRADHPFLFLIRHRPSGTVLFLGRLVNPEP